MKRHKELLWEIWRHLQYKLQIPKAGEKVGSDKEKEWVSDGSLNEYEGSLMNSKTKQKQERLKSIALVKAFKRMEQKFKLLCVGIDLLQISTSKGIINASAERQRGLNLTDRVVSLKGTDCVRW